MPDPISLVIVDSKTVKLAILIVCTLSMSALSACVPSTRSDPVLTPYEVMQTKTITPIAEPITEDASRTASDITAESTLTFNISGWT
mgnify:CR=1